MKKFVQKHLNRQGQYYRSGSYRLHKPTGEVLAVVGNELITWLFLSNVMSYDISATI
jgi:hypothetical protein